MKRHWSFLSLGRRAAIVGAAGVAFLFVLYVVFWFVAVGQVRGLVLGWLDARAGEGYGVRYRHVATGGFPHRLRVTLAGPSLSGPRPDRPWRWEAERVVLELAPWNFRRYRLLAPGAHSIELVAGIEPVAAAGSVEELVLEIEDAGDRSAATLHIVRLDLGNSLGAVGLDEGRVRARRLGTPSDHRSASLEIGVDGRGLRLPKQLVLPFGPEIDRLAFEARLMGALGDGPPAEALAAWRDSGGTLEIAKLELAHGPVVAEASGTLALDDRLQPLAAFTARFQGLLDLIDGLGRLGVLRPRDAATAKLVLAALGRRSETGQVVHAVPVTVQQQRLYLGPVAVAELPLVRW